MDENEKLEAVKRLLNKRYLEWQQGMEERKTITEFAVYLGFPQSTVSFWINGARLIKNRDDIEQLASKIGFEIYDALGVPRPDEDLFYLQQNWEEYPPELRRQLREQGENYSSKNKKKRK